MPELRKGVCRGRAKLAQPQQPQETRKQTRNQGRKRAAAAVIEVGRPRTRLAAKRLKEEEEHPQVVVISERESDILKELAKDNKAKEAVMADDSGGLSANKAAGQEEEGSTAPFPERVCFCFIFESIYIFNDSPLFPFSLINYFSLCNCLSI